MSPFAFFATIIGGSLGMFIFIFYVCHKKVFKLLIHSIRQGDGLSSNTRTPISASKIELHSDSISIHIYKNRIMYDWNLNMYYYVCNVWFKFVTFKLQHFYFVMCRLQETCLIPSYENIFLIFNKRPQIRLTISTRGSSNDLLTKLLI